MLYPTTAVNQRQPTWFMRNVHARNPLVEYGLSGADQKLKTQNGRKH